MVEQIGELPSGAVLPSMGGLSRAGSSGEQAALQDRAWTMLEMFKTNGGEARTRLSNDWLGSHDWRVQITSHYKLASPEIADFRRLTNVIRTSGETGLLGTVVEPGELRHSAVWYLPIDGDAIGRFFEAHYARFHMLYPPDLRFAIHANDGDYAFLAGPKAFVRAALEAGDIGPAATSRVVAAIEDEHGSGCMDSILEHYAPFMMDDD